MVYIIIAAVAVFLAGYFVGSNNPTASVKAKVIAAAKTAAGKL